MTKQRLASLTLDHFRGASRRVTIPFSDKPITLLFGENGTGKSSVVDGLEFVLNGTPGSIEGISGASPGAHLSSLNSTSADIFAEATLDDDSTFGATLSRSKITQTPKGTTPCPKATFLRRTKILDLIRATPGDKYKALAGFIDVAGVEFAENSLNTAIRGQQKNLDSTIYNIQSSTTELQRLYSGHADVDERELGFEKWAAKNAAIDIGELKKDVADLAKVVADYTSANNALTEANTQQQLWEKTHTEKETTEKAYQEAIKTSPEAVGLLLELLNAGKTYIQAVRMNIEKCPLCGNVTNRELLIAKIEAKLNSLPGIANAKKLRDEADATDKQCAKTCKESYLRFLKAARLLLMSVEALVEGRRYGINPNDVKYADLKTLPATITLSHVTRESTAPARAFVAQCSALFERWSDDYNKLEPRKTLLSSIQTHLTTLMTGRKEAKTLEKVRDHLQAISEVVRPIRQDFVDNTLRSVASDCDRLYAEMHPTEPIGGICLVLDKAKRASCELTGEFFGKKNIPPQAYYSESHMDTLGFALFLALAKRGASGETIVVLDDIFTSVDDRHLKHVCDLLSTEVVHFRQIILATHIRKIFDWVRSGHLPQNVFGLVELSSQWSLTEGLQARFAEVDREEIETLLDAKFLDRTSLAGKVRRFLEALLGDMVITLGARAPMKKHGDYELADYLGGLLSLVKDGWQVVHTHESPGVLRESHPRESYQLASKAKEFNESKNVVNKLIHADDGGAAYSDDEAREFAKEVLEFEKYLRCDNPNCGSLIGSNKHFLTCKCGQWKLDMRPAKKQVMEKVTT